MTASTTIIIILILITTASLVLHITDRTEMDEMHEELWDIMDRIEELRDIVDQIENLQEELTITSEVQAGTIQPFEFEIELDEEKKKEIFRQLDEMALKGWSTWNIKRGIITDAGKGHNGGENHDQSTDQEDTEEGVERRGVYIAERSEELHGLGE